MQDCSIIIQGEGKGHFSQALVLAEILNEKHYKIKRVYCGKSLFRNNYDYINSFSNAPIKTFFSPGFLLSGNGKGIRLFQSIILNLLFGPVYIFEIFRLGILLAGDKSNVIFNFFDPIGALAGKWMNNKVKRIVISHHFYLSHPDFIHPHGFEKSYFRLHFLNWIMIKSAHRVLALSFRKGKSYRKIEVIPPLVDSRIKVSRKLHGNFDLCYFLNPGFAEDALNYYGRHPEINAVIYADLKIEKTLPENVKICRPSRDGFIASMKDCKRIITTGGFDTVAEAFYLGIPTFIIPSENHYEQYCNALDASRTNMAFQLEHLNDLEEAEFSPTNNKAYKDWVNSDTFENILKGLA